MADTKTSALAELTTPAAADEFMAVDKSDTTMGASGTNKFITYANLEAAVTAAVDKVFAKNALDSDTGITVDAGTDVSAALDTLLEAGHSTVYLPGGTYTIAAQMTPAISSSVRVILAPGAILKATAALDVVMFEPVITNNAHVTFTGGVYDVGEARNSSSVLFSTVGAYDNSGNSNGGVFSFRNDTAGTLVIENYVMTSRTDSHDKSFIDPAEQHWMGRSADVTYDETGGASEDLWTGTAHPFNDNDEVYFSAVGTGATGYAASTKYFVINATANTFQLSATLGGAAIAGTGDSAGTWTLDANNGGDSHIFANASDGGELIARNGVHLGSRSSCIYIAGGVTGAALGDLAWCSIDNIRMYWCAGGISVKGDHETWTVTNCHTYGCPEGFKSEDGTGTLGAIRGSFVNCKSVGAYQPFMAQDTDSVHFVNCIAEDLGCVDRDGVAFTTSVTSFNTRPRAIWLHGAQKCVVRGHTARGTNTSWAATRLASSQPQAVRIDASATDLRQSKDNIFVDLFMDDIEEFGEEITRASATDPNNNRLFGVRMGEGMTDYSTLVMLGADSYVDFQDERSYVIASDQSWTNSTTTGVTGWQAIPVKGGAVYAVTIEAMLSNAAATGDFKLRIDPGTGSTMPGWLTSDGLHTTTTSAAASLRREGQDPVDQTNPLSVGVMASGTGVTSATFKGVLAPATTMTFDVDAAQDTADGSNATVLHDYSVLTLKRIG